MEQTKRSMNILQVASGFPAWGGTELHLLNLGNQLRLRGHRVTIACRPDGWVYNKAKEMQLDILPATVKRQQDWTDFNVLRDWCKENKCDVMHVHWSTDAFVPTFAARAAGVPVRLMTRHSPYPFKTGLGRWIFTHILYNRIIAISNSVSKTLHKCGVPQDKLTVIHHGTNVGEFEAITIPANEVRSDLGVGEKQIAVGIIGRIAQEKGHKYLLEATQKIKDQYPITIVIVGDGPDIEINKAFVKELGIEDRVIFSPFRSDVNNIFNAMDIVVVPSTWEEPCSAVIQQAMALSKPVIGTLTGGSPEMILDGETGLLVQPSDSQMLADAVAKLAADADLRVSMGKAGRERVEQYFSLQVMTDKVEALYRSEYELACGAGSLSQKVPASV